MVIGISPTSSKSLCLPDTRMHGCEFVARLILVLLNPKSGFKLICSSIGQQRWIIFRNHRRCRYKCMSFALQKIDKAWRISTDFMSLSFSRDSFGMVPTQPVTSEMVSTRSTMRLIRNDCNHLNSDDAE